MTSFTPLRELPKQGSFSKNDVFVLFGELFARGYANGLVEAARDAGMKIVGITVGRRDSENRLRPLAEDELAEAEKNLGGKIINVPLWAGFDMDAPEGGLTPVEQLDKFKSKEWEESLVDWAQIDASKEVGVQRFKTALNEVMRQLEGELIDGGNLFFAHIMAGGIPRAKVLLLLTNHVVKGKGKRYLSSETLWGSDLGKVTQQNMREVTANTLQYLLDASEAIRKKVQEKGGQVRYIAYGYHGTEILINGKYQWQTYNPYLPGTSKLELEKIAAKAWEEGVKVSVFNCPEIRTNSSDIFSGVELSLYPLLTSLQQEGGGEWAQKQLEVCQELLVEGKTVEDLLRSVDDYHRSEVMQEFYNDFASWPRHNTRDSAEIMLDASDATMKQNRSKTETVTHYLSELVVKSTGRLIFHESWEPTAPVLWLGHDIISKELNLLHS